MAAKVFFNGLSTSCASQITSTQTSIVCQSTATWSPTGDYIVRIDGFAPGTTTAIFEYVLVQSNVQGTGTITGLRGQDSTVGQAFAAGATLTPDVSGKMFNDAFARIDTTATQAFSGPISIPPAAGVALPAGIYGSVPVKLDDQSSGASAASLTLTISGTSLYRVLEVDFFGRSDQAAGANVSLQFNGDTAANYDSGFMSDVNTTITGTAPVIAGTTGFCASVNGTNANAAAISHFRIVINNADGASSFRKSWQFSGGYFSADSAAGFVYEAGQGQWRNTTSQITSIKFIPGAGSLVSCRGIAYGKP